MQTLYLALFDAIAAGFFPDPTVLAIARLTTAIAPWAAAVLMAIAAFRTPRLSPYVLIALAVAVATAMLGKDIAAALASPRPFMVGLSPSHIAHGARGGLPSTHAAVMFAVASMLLLRPALRATGVAVAALAAVTAWSRIYLGIHFPLDIVAGATLGAVVAGGVALALSTIEGHLDDAAGATHAARHPLTRALLHGNASRYAVIACAAAALAIGLAMPQRMAAGLVQEGGPVETGTVVLYLLAIVGVLATQGAALGAADKTALGIVLLSLAAWEIDLPELGFGGRYRTFAIALPLAFASAWLVLQFGVNWRRFRGTPRWRTPALTVMTFVGVALLVGVLEITPVALSELGMRNRLPAIVWQAMVGLEELLEMLMPALAMLALLQIWLGRERRGAAAGTHPAP
jgi:membrane-associated phospholipid phosphatase